jgi:hypothetical protein
MFYNSFNILRQLQLILILFFIPDYLQSEPISINQKLSLSQNINDPRKVKKILNIDRKVDLRLVNNQYQQYFKNQRVLGAQIIVSNISGEQIAKGEVISPDILEKKLVTKIDFRKVCNQIRSSLPELRNIKCIGVKSKYFATLPNREVDYLIDYIIEGIYKSEREKIIVSFNLNSNDIVSIRTDKLHQHKPLTYEDSSPNKPLNPSSIANFGLNIKNPPKGAPSRKSAYRGLWHYYGIRSDIKNMVFPNNSGKLIISDPKLRIAVVEDIPGYQSVQRCVEVSPRQLNTPLVSFQIDGIANFLSYELFINNLIKGNIFDSFSSYYENRNNISIPFVDSCGPVSGYIPKHIIKVEKNDQIVNTFFEENYVNFSYGPEINKVAFASASDPMIVAHEFSHVLHRHLSSAKETFSPEVGEAFADISAITFALDAKKRVSMQQDLYRDVFPIVLRNLIDPFKIGTLAYNPIINTDNRFFTRSFGIPPSSNRNFGNNITGVNYDHFKNLPQNINRFDRLRMSHQIGQILAHSYYLMLNGGENVSAKKFYQENIEPSSYFIPAFNANTLVYEKIYPIIFATMQETKPFEDIQIFAKKLFKNTSTTLPMAEHNTVARALCATGLLEGSDCYCKKNDNSTCAKGDDCSCTESTPTPTATSTPLKSPTATSTSTITPTRTSTPNSSPTATPTPRASTTPLATATPTAINRATPTVSTSNQKKIRVRFDRLLSLYTLAANLPDGTASLYCGNLVYGGVCANRGVGLSCLPNRCNNDNSSYNPIDLNAHYLDYQTSFSRSYEQAFSQMCSSALGVGWQYDSSIQTVAEGVDPVCAGFIDSGTCIDLSKTYSIFDIHCKRTY